MTGAPTGLVSGTGVTAQVVNASSGAVAVAAATSITETPASSGVYVAAFTAPSAIGEYVVIWTVTSGATVTTVAEELFVTGSPPVPTTQSSGEQYSRTLADLRNEVLNHGFDGTIYSTTRLNQYLNDALSELSSKAQYYGEEQQQATSTVAGTSHYNFPTGMTKLRSVRLPDYPQELTLLDLRDIDRSQQTTGRPYAYAIDGSGITLFPTPDAAYALDIRYWSTLPPLVNDTDSPGIPARYHTDLAFYAIARCFEGEDDPQQATYYQQKWDQTLRDLKADLVFPLTDGPRQIRSQWDTGVERRPGWGYW